MTTVNGSKRLKDTLYMLLTYKLARVADCSTIATCLFSGSTGWHTYTVSKKRPIVETV